MADHRRILNFRDVGIRDVPVFGWYEYYTPHPGLRTHTHPNTLEICYLNRGRQTYWVGGRDYHLTGGDVFITLPGEPHSTGSNPEDRGVLYWLNLRMPRRGRPLLSLSTGDTTLLTNRLLSLPQRHFGGASRLKHILDDIFALYDQSNNPLRCIAINNRLVAFLLEIVDCAERHAKSRPTEVVTKIIRQIESKPEQEYSIADLAKQTGLSVSRFKARFKAEVGVPPNEFVLRNKIEAAKRQLAGTSDSITQIAMRLGFSSSQYFATVFKRYTKRAPREYRHHGPAVPFRPGEELFGV
jgi:AraC-like DNA-binding protein